MQSNNNLRPFSTNTTNIYSDAQLDTLAEVKQGAISGAAADSKLYNSLSACTSLLSTAITDFLALHNPDITFGQTLPIESWISAVNKSIKPRDSVIFSAATASETTGQTFDNSVTFAFSPTIQLNEGDILEITFSPTTDLGVGVAPAIYTGKFVIPTNLTSTLTALQPYTISYTSQIAEGQSVLNYRIFTLTPSISTTFLRFNIKEIELSVSSSGIQSMVVNALKSVNIYKIIKIN